jgi:hypothetical protein
VSFWAAGRVLKSFPKPGSTFNILITVSVNLLKVNKAMHHQEGNKSVAQSSKVSEWLWSVATNLNLSKLRAQDNKALIQRPDPTVLHPSILKGSHPSSYPISLGVSWFPRDELARAPESSLASPEAQSLSTYGLASGRCGLCILGDPLKGSQKVLFEFCPG